MLYWNFDVIHYVIHVIQNHTVLNYNNCYMFSVMLHFVLLYWIVLAISLLLFLLYTFVNMYTYMRHYTQIVLIHRICILRNRTRESGRLVIVVWSENSIYVIQKPVPQMPESPFPCWHSLLWTIAACAADLQSNKCYVVKPFFGLYAIVNANTKVSM